MKFYLSDKEQNIIIPVVEGELIIAIHPEQMEAQAFALTAFQKCVDSHTKAQMRELLENLGFPANLLNS